MAPVYEIDDDLCAIGDEVVDAAEDAFVTFATASSDRDLGMLDSKATSVEVTVGSKAYTIAQSPGLLRSTRDGDSSGGGGTTGAVLWQTAVELACWLERADNPLFARGLLGRDSHVVELGCGISPVLLLTFQGRVARYTATDQGYVLRMFRQNLEGNEVERGGSRRKGPLRARAKTRVEVCELDWELDDVLKRAPWHAQGERDGAELLVACDCVYNEHLVPAFVQACKAVCQLAARGEGEQRRRPTICLVAQQLRAPDVFETWLEHMSREFRVWRVRDDGRAEVLSDKGGFAVHLAVLK